MRSLIEVQTLRCSQYAQSAYAHKCPAVCMYNFYIHTKMAVYGSGSFDALVSKQVHQQNTTRHMGVHSPRGCTHMGSALP